MSKPAQSSSRNPLEQPWALDEEAFTRWAKLISPNPSLNLFRQARGETAALTEEITKVETEIDERVKGLYGL